MKIVVRFDRITFWHRPFELELDVEDGEDVDDALERHWCSGLIPGHAERVVEANEIASYEIVKRDD